MVLVTGGGGQLGKALLEALHTQNVPCLGVDREDFDIADRNAAWDAITSIRPSTVIHCAAYTAVDAAEDFPEDCERINVLGTRNIADICCDISADLVFISTDYVFNDSGTGAIDTNAPRDPLNVYGATKMQAENIVATTLERFYIIRTSWLFGAGGPNFITKVLERVDKFGCISVVEDQIGSPTYARDFAGLVCALIQTGKYGYFHATNEGFCSFADIAEEVMKLTGSDGRLKRVCTKEFPTKAQRPTNSRLSKESLDIAGLWRLPPWQDAVARYLKEIGRI